MEHGKLTNDMSILSKKPETVKLVLFTGGADVDPAYYGEKLNPKSYTNPGRDKQEKEVFEIADKYSIPMMGICRGAQFLNVMAGGKLVQHVTGHGGHHQVQANSEFLPDDISSRFRVSSTHHQMIRLPEDAVLLAWANPKLSNVYEGGPEEDLDIQVEVEAAYYPSINAIGAQFHPESSRPDSLEWRYFQYLISSLLEKQLQEV